MEYPWIVTGGVGLLISLRYGKNIDQAQRQLAAEIRRRLAQKAQREESLVPELPIITRLIACLRSGQSLDSSLEQIISDPNFAELAKSRLKKVLAQEAERDFFSQYLAGALKSGAPILHSLSSLQRLLLVEKRMQLRARGISGQARAQAEALSWLPWLLAGGFAFIDPSWFQNSIHSAESWLCWSLAMALCGFGRAWIMRSVDQCLRAKNQKESALENDLPALVLHFSTQLSLGLDPSTCLEKLIKNDVTNPLKSWLIEVNEETPPSVRNFRSLVDYADRSGAPLRIELENFLFELQSAKESKWEERLQQLPIHLLAPLFCCFFPTSFLILIGLLFPFFKELF
jgi:hypothetical protein